MLALNFRVGEGLQIGNAAFLRLVEKDRDAFTVLITTRLPKLQVNLGGDNEVTIAPRLGQGGRALISGQIAPVKITPPGITPQAFAIGIDGQSRYVARTPQAASPMAAG